MGGLTGFMIKFHAKSMKFVKKQLNKMVFGGNIEDASEILKKQQGLKRASLTIY